MGGSAVADGEHFGVIGFDPLLHQVLGLLNFAVRGRRVNHPGVQHFSSAVDNGSFAAGSVTGIQSDGDFSFDWRLHEQLAQVGGKHLNRRIAGLFGQLIADFTFDGRKNQPVIGIICRLANRRSAGRVLPYVL